MTDLIILVGDKLGLPLWATIALVVVVIFGALFGAYFLGRLRDMWRHHSRDFPDGVIIQRSTVVGGKLALRTLGVRRLSEIMIDPELARLVEAAAARTTEDYPGIVLDDPRLHREMMAGFINAASPFVPLGRGVQLMAATKERYPSMTEARQQNVIRLLVSSEKWTEQFKEASADKPVALSLGNPLHAPRRDRTLPWVARTYAVNNGYDAKGRLLIAMLGSPWEDDEPK